MAFADAGEVARDARSPVEDIAPADEILNFVTRCHDGPPLSAEGCGRSSVPQPCASVSCTGGGSRHEKDSQNANHAAISRAWKMSGWGTWIRTRTDGVRVRCSTVKLFPNGVSRRSVRRPLFNNGVPIVNTGLVLKGRSVRLPGRFRDRVHLFGQRAYLRPPRPCGWARCTPGGASSFRRVPSGCGLGGITHG